MKTKLLFSLAALGIVVAGALTIRPVPQVAEFCDECVLRKDVVQWRLAGRWTLFQIARTEATPISELLEHHHAVQTHEHRWSAPEHVAEAALETPDAPRIRSIGFLNTPRAASFLRSLFDHTDEKDRKAWRQVAWQPTIASVMEPSLRFARFPESGFATRAEFLNWWQGNAHPLFNHLQALTVAD